MAIGIGLTASTAHAGSFDGPFVQLGVGQASLSTTITTDYRGDGLGISETRKQAQNGVLGSVVAGYSHALPHSFNLAANLFYHFGSQNAGVGSLNLGDNTYVKFQSKLQNVWGLSVEPGYYVADNTLGYLKLGWAMGTASSTISGSDSGSDFSFPAARAGTSHGI